MPTSYTSLLGLALPTTGELSGTWGTTVNDAITSLLDSAVAGTTTLSTDADVTLTTTDGAANQARSAVLLCSGARTVLRTITAPAKSKGYVIINATTGGFDVKIVGVGPTTGVLVPAGTRAFVVWNGSDFVKVAASAIAASDITGVLATANGGTNLSSFTANKAVYATSTSALTTGTLPVEGGGTGAATLTANNVLLGNGTSPVQVVAPGTAGNVLTSDGATWISQAISGVVTPSANNAFTGANTFYNNTGQTFGTATSTQDGILLTGRAGGTSSFRVTFVPGTLTASRTVTLPDAAGTVVLDSATQTLSAKTLSAPTLSGTVTGGDGLLTRVMFQDTGWDYHDSGTTNALDYVNGSVQRWAPNTGAQTLSITNWPPSGAMGELLIEGVNLGAATITWPTINWIKSDGTTTTTFSANGVTLQTSGTDWVFLWTRNGGTTIYGKVVR